MADLEEYLTTEEFCTVAKIKRNTAEIWRGQGKGPPFIKLGPGSRAAVRYRRSDVIAWLAQRTFTSTSQQTVAARAASAPAFAVGPSEVPRPWEGNTRTSSQPRGASE